jgi:hypothetical protein
MRAEHTVRLVVLASHQALDLLLQRHRHRSRLLRSTAAAR